MDAVPPYVSIVFILTTFAAVAFLIQAIKAVGVRTLPSQILIFLLPLWILFTAVLSIGGFYTRFDVWPPRIVLFAVLPSLLVVVCYFIFFRRSFIERLPLRLITLLHVVRIPVEIVLLWLFFAGLVPQSMTFEGRNFDILSGVLAPMVWFLGFRGGERRWLLIGYNLLGLGLLSNIVLIAVRAMPSPTFDPGSGQPNIGVAFFPYIWLPAIVVPIVLFSHLAVLWNLIGKRD